MVQANRNSTPEYPGGCLLDYLDNGVPNKVYRCSGQCALEAFCDTDGITNIVTDGNCDADSYHTNETLADLLRAYDAEL